MRSKLLDKYMTDGDWTNESLLVEINKIMTENDLEPYHFNYLKKVTSGNRCPSILLAFLIRKLVNAESEKLDALFIPMEENLPISSIAPASDCNSILIHHSRNTTVRKRLQTGSIAFQW